MVKMVSFTICVFFHNKKYVWDIKWKGGKGGSRGEAGLHRGIGPGKGQILSPRGMCQAAPGHRAELTRAPWDTGHFQGESSDP